MFCRVTLVAFGLLQKPVWGCTKPNCMWRRETILLCDVLIAQHEEMARISISGTSYFQLESSVSPPHPPSPCAVPPHPTLCHPISPLPSPPSPRCRCRCRQLSGVCLPLQRPRGAGQRAVLYRHKRQVGRGTARLLML